LKDNDYRKLNVLIAYPYMKNKIKNLTENYARLNFLLDSGAFTAWKAGTKINLDEYCNFIESLPFKPWNYFTLDVIGDPAATMNNYQTMLNRGFKPIPIFTRGESIDVLDEYYKTSDIVGIGGLVGTQNNKGFVKGIMHHVKDRKVHWLGFTNIDFIKYYKPYMCDSSSWNSGFQYGQVRFYIGGGKFVRINRKNILDVKIKEVLSRQNIDLLDSRKDRAWRNSGSKTFLDTCAANSAIRLSVDIKKTFGTHLFNAVAAADCHLKSLIIEHKRILEIL